MLGNFVIVSVHGELLSLCDDGYYFDKPSLFTVFYDDLRICDKLVKDINNCGIICKSMTYDKYKSIFKEW